MNKNQKIFLISMVVVFLAALLASLSYYQYQGSKIKTQQQAIQNIFSQPKVGKPKEKGFFTKIKESIFGSEEEKIEQEIQEKMQKILELEEKYKSGSKIDENAIKEFHQISSEIQELQNKYYDIAGKYYEFEATQVAKQGGEAVIEKKDKQVRKDQKEETATTEKAQKEKVGAKKGLEEKIITSYVEQGYLEKKPSVVKKLTGLFSKSNTKVLRRDTQEIKITEEKDKLVVEEMKDGKKIAEWIYSSSDTFETVRLEEKNVAEAYTAIFENMESGKAVKKYDNGEKIEYFHKNKIPTGKAVKYFPDGDREEFYYQNGLKNGFSVYYFQNGDREEVYYIKDQIQGNARYIYADGFVENYQYKDGKRMEAK